MSYRIQSTIRHNGTSVSSTGWSISFSTESAVTRWSITLDEFPDISSDDTFSIDRAFGKMPDVIENPVDRISGGGVTVLPGILPKLTTSFSSGLMASGAGGSVLSEAHPDSWGRHVSRGDVSLVVSGTSGGTSGIGANLTLGLDTYFVSPAYLQQLCPNGWVVMDDGALYYQATGPMSGKQRVVGDGLPAMELPIGSFRVIVTDPAHLSIAKWLCREAGMEFFSNCPYVALKRAFLVQADKGIMQAILDLYRLWQPTGHIRERKGGDIIFEVLDAAKSNPATEQPQHISLALKAIKVIDYSERAQNEEAIVDHVIVKGAKTFSMASMPNYGSNLSPITIPEVSLTENRDKHWTDNTDSLANKKVFGDYKQQFGKDGAALSQARPTHVERYEYFYEDPNDPTNWILLRERSETFTNLGLFHVIETKHKYGRGYTPIGSVEEEQLVTNWPGRPDKQLRNVRRKIIDQSHVIDGMKRALAKELIEELIVANKIVPQDGTPSYYVGPVSLKSAQEQNRISTSPTTTQEVLEMTTKIRNVTVNRITAGVLNQITTEFDTISGITSVKSQIIKDPTKTNSDRQETQFIAHFTRGQSQNKAVTIEHPDIDNLTLANEVANRIFERSQEAKIELTIQVLAPLSIGGAAFVVNIPSIAIKRKVVQHTSEVISKSPETGTVLGPTVSISSGGTSIIPGGKYVGVDFSEALNETDSGPNHSITLKLRSTL